MAGEFISCVKSGLMDHINDAENAHGAMLFTCFSEMRPWLGTLGHGIAAATSTLGHSPLQ